MSQGGSVTAAPIAPYRIRPPVVRDSLAELCSTENGPVVYARLALAQAERVAVATQVSSSARRLQSQGGRRNGRRRRKSARAGGNGTKNTVTPTGATVQIPKAKKASLLAEKLLHDMS